MAFTESPEMTDLIKSSERVGYFACLSDLSKWLVSATHNRAFDTSTLFALADELDRLTASKTARPVGAIAADVVSRITPNGEACGRNSAQQQEERRSDSASNPPTKVNKQGPALSAEPTPPLSQWKDR